MVNVELLNIIMREIEGDMKLLPLTNGWHMVFVGGSRVVLLPSEVMK